MQHFPNSFVSSIFVTDYRLDIKCDTKDIKRQAPGFAPKPQLILRSPRLKLPLAYSSAGGVFMQKTKRSRARRPCSVRQIGINQSDFESLSNATICPDALLLNRDCPSTRQCISGNASEISCVFHNFTPILSRKSPRLVSLCFPNRFDDSTNLGGCAIQQDTGAIDLRSKEANTDSCSSQDGNGGGDPISILLPSFFISSFSAP